MELKDLYNIADYKDSNGMMFNNDCFEIMKDIPDKSVDCIICDLPYGTQINNTEDICVFSKAYAREIKDKVKMIYNPQFTQGKPYKIPKESKTTEIFSTNHKNGVYKHTNRDTSQRYPFITLEFNMDKPRVHPTQKPIALLEYLVKTYTNENNLVLDNCMGSGTTCLACKNLNRRYIGIEKEKKYFDIACERLNKVESVVNV